MSIVVPSLHRRGFTLIELSIVLVIIGLVVGGILAGRDLIRHSQLRRIMSQADETITAMNTFRLKYNALPGDMTNATTLWGADASCPNTPTNTVAKQQTCNGNGDGRIRKAGYDTDSSYDYEMFRFWQHLANAGLIAGQYSGVTGSASATNRVPGINVPRTSIANVSLLVTTTLGTYTMNPGSCGFDSISSHSIGAAGDNNGTYVPFLTTQEAFALDQKYDDGMPGLGRVLGVRSDCSTVPACTTTTNKFTTQWNVAQPNTLCVFSVQQYL